MSNNRLRRQQPAEKRNEQQQTKKTAARDDAHEISSRPRYIEISSMPNILVGRLLDVFSLASTNIRQGAVAATAASDTAASSAMSCSTPTSSDEATTRSGYSTTIAAA